MGVARERSRGLGGIHRYNHRLFDDTWKKSTPCIAWFISERTAAYTISQATTGTAVHVMKNEKWTHSTLLFPNCRDKMKNQRTVSLSAGWSFVWSVTHHIKYYISVGRWLLLLSNHDLQFPRQRVERQHVKSTARYAIAISNRALPGFPPDPGSLCHYFSCGQYGACTGISFDAYNYKFLSVLYLQ